VGNFWAHDFLLDNSAYNESKINGRYILSKEVIKMPKLTVQFDSKVNKLIQELAERKSTTKTEIIRRALITYKYLDDETLDDDKRVSVTSTKEDKILKDIILP